MAQSILATHKRDITIGDLLSIEKKSKYTVSHSPSKSLFGIINDFFSVWWTGLGGSEQLYWMESGFFSFPSLVAALYLLSHE